MTPKPMKVAVFFDPNDAYSRSLHNSLIENIDLKKPNIVVSNQSYSYTVQDTATLANPIANALNDNVDFIFFAGYAYDLDALENQLQIQQQQQQNRGQGHRPIILGGDGLYDLKRYIENPYAIVYSTVYASPLATNDSFVQAYARAFGIPSIPSSDQQFSYLPPHAILSFEAVRTVGCVLQLYGGSDLPDQATFDNELKTVTCSGVGTNDIITLQGNLQTGQSNPLDKPVYILCTNRDHTLHKAAEDIPGKPLTPGDISACR